MVHRLFLAAGIAVFILVISHLALASGSTTCELKVREGYRYYALKGKSIDELRAQMEHGGTKWNDGKVYSAMTNWDIHYKYDVACRNGRYTVKSVDTSVDIHYFFPRLDSAACSPSLAAVWREYMTHLQRHEFGHKDLAVKAASEMNEMFATLPSFGTEEELATEVERRTKEKFRHLKEVQVEYDRDTRHGETQGATLTAQVPALHKKVLVGEAGKPGGA